MGSVPRLYNLIYKTDFSSFPVIEYLFFFRSLYVIYYDLFHVPTLLEF